MLPQLPLQNLAADYDGDLHDMNIGIREVYGDVAVMLAGDAEAKFERELLAAGVDLSADVLNMGLHGSSTSSTLGFAQAASPDLAIYQAGEGNSYGHPHEAAIASVLEAGATVYGTDMHGTVVISSDVHSYTA